MATKRKKTPIMVSATAHNRAKHLAEELSLKMGRFVTLKEIVDRALEALGDAHSIGAWLNPQQSWALMQERVEMSMTAVITSVVRHYEPGARVRVEFNPVAETLTIEVNGKPFMVKSVDKETAMDSVKN